MTESYSSGLIALAQFMTIISLLFLLTLFIEFTIPSKWFFAPLLLILIVFNWYRYERNFNIDDFSARWKDEDSLAKKKNGWLIVAYFIIVIFIPVTIGILRNNLGVI